jgi:carboxyl-terminal processing protease
MDAEAIGYLRISSFQENTLQEVQEALAQLNTKGIKGLVLDLRGNPGGLFRSAVQISELFLGSGVIVISRSPIKSYKGPIKADIANPFELPMAVLIDSDTASSAEVLAGALKERPGTRLMGQTSYGKGSIQSVIPLGKSMASIRMSAGIRLTVAHLFSPTRDEPYTGRGISPHDFLDPEGESILTPARAALLQTIRGMMMIR